MSIMKEEMGGGGGGSGGEGGGLELRQQSAQNEKLRETLVRMRDLMAHEKNAAMKMAKDLKEKTAEGAELAKHNAKLASQVRLDKGIAQSRKTSGVLASQPARPSANSGSV